MNKKVFAFLIMALFIMGCANGSNEVVTPTSVPTAIPTAAPTTVPTVAATETPTIAPTATPTAVPTATPTNRPTATPTNIPTATSTPVPTEAIAPTGTAIPTPSSPSAICTDEESYTYVTLCEYKGLELTAVSDDQVQAEINKLLSSLEYEADKNGFTETGDTVYIYFVGTIDGVAFSGGTYEEGDGYPLVLGSGAFIPGFEEQLIGYRAGDSVDVKVSFPENYGVDELNGKEAVFAVTVNRVVNILTPALTDELAKEKLEAESAEELINSTREALNREAYETQLSQFLLSNCIVENLNQDEVAETANYIYNSYYSYASMLANFYGVDAETIMYYYFGFGSIDDLYEYSVNYAVYECTYLNILKAIAIKENLELSDEASDKVLEFIIENAVIE